MCSRLLNGINIIWRIELPEDLSDFHPHLKNINWLTSNIVFKITLYYDNVFELLQIFINAGREKSFTLYGSVSVVSSVGSIQHLDKFCCTKLPNLLNLKLLREYMLSNNTLTLLIQLWNTPEKYISASYYAYSKLHIEKCNFEWKLNTLCKKKKYGIGKTPCHVFLRKIPRKFTTYVEKIKHGYLAIELAFQNFLEMNGHYTIRLNSSLFINGIIKIDAVSYNSNSLNLINTRFSRYQGYMKTFDDEKIQDLITKKYLFYPRKYLILNVCIECKSYLDAEITEVDYLSDPQNISALIEISNNHHKQAIAKNSSSKTLSTSMYALYKESKFCDVTLCVGEEKILCHKSVLCARSPVFRAMFENGMQEQESNVVQIRDMNTRSFGIFVDILYTDSLVDIEWDDVLRVYETADKYDVSEIREMCSEFLSSKLSMTNVCQILEFSIEHQDEDLMKQIKGFIANDAKEVIKLPEWNGFMLRNPLFAAKFMHDTFCP